MFNESVPTEIGAKAKPHPPLPLSCLMHINIQYNLDISSAYATTNSKGSTCKHQTHMLALIH
jgi:hypothetical protein